MSPDTRAGYNFNIRVQHNALTSIQKYQEIDSNIEIKNYVISRDHQSSSVPLRLLIACGFIEYNLFHNHLKTNST